MANALLLNSNDDLECMVDGYIRLLIHICRMQRATGTGDLDVHPEWPGSRTHPLRCQLRGTLLFALSGVLEVFVDETVQWRLLRVLLGKRKDGGVTPIRVLQGTEDLPGRARPLRETRNLSVVCYFLYQKKASEWSEQKL